jgi:hypothetical protein
MSSLDQENLNPLRGDGSLTLKGVPLENSIRSLGPSMGRFGVDIAEFQRKAATSLIELPRTWREFIQKEAKKVLSGDLNRLMSNIDKNFERKCIKSSEVNSIVNFVLSYYEVIHRRAINKKEVVEGVLMRGLIKKSSFYAKISQADNNNEGLLTWDQDSSHNDDIWRHFTLQTCRFIKQAIGDMEHFLDEPAALKTQLQDLIDREERDQFNRGSGRRAVGQWLPFLLFGVGVTGMFLMPNGANDQMGVQKQMASEERGIFMDGKSSKDFAKPLELSGANLLETQGTISVNRGAIPVKY